MKRIHNSVGADEKQFSFGPQQIRNPHGLAEVPKVGTAAHADVLAVVDQFACGLIDERTGTTSQPGPGLQQCHGDVAFRQCNRSRQPGQPATDDNRVVVEISIAIGNVRPLNLKFIELNRRGTENAENHLMNNSGYRVLQVAQRNEEGGQILILLLHVLLSRSQAPLGNAGSGSSASR